MGYSAHPQRLKPEPVATPDGTAEAVPYQFFFFRYIRSKTAFGVGYWMLTGSSALRPSRYCGSFRPRSKLSLGVHLCDPRDRGVVTAVIC